MTPDALLRQRQLLQEQLQRGEIDQATYDRMLAFLQALEVPPSAAPSNETPTMPTATPARTAGDATPASPFGPPPPLPGGERPRPGLQVGDYRLALLSAGFLFLPAAGIALRMPEAVAEQPASTD